MPRFCRIGDQAVRLVYAERFDCKGLKRDAGDQSKLSFADQFYALAGLRALEQLLLTRIKMRDLKQWGQTRQTLIAASNSSDNSLCHPPA